MHPVAQFDQAVERFADRIAIATARGSYSFAAVQAMSETFAGRLADCGVGPADRVAVWSRNSHVLLVLHVAVLRLGAVWSPLSAQTSPTTAIAYLTFIEPRVLLCGRDEFQHGCQLARVTPGLRCLSIDALAGELGPATTAGSTERWRGPVRADALIEQPLMALVPTGGTTSAPKAVKQSRRAFETLIETLRRGFEYDTDMPVCLSVSPLSHSAGAQAFALWTLGGANIVMRKFSAPRVLEAIERHRVTHMFVPPTALAYLNAIAETRRFDCSSLREIRVGGEPVAPSTLTEAIATFGPCVSQTYGQIEAPFLTWMDRTTLAAAVAGEHPERLRSCGRPSPGVGLRVQGATRPTPPGECGEIVVKGDGIPCAYYGADPGRPADEWHHTGDIGYLDADGFLYLVARQRDVIVTGGTNVYASDVEAAIMAIDGVRECAVLGVPDAVVGERLVAAVVAANSLTVSQTGVIEHCRRLLGRLRAPRSVTFVPILPRTPVGKIDKRELRSRLTEAPGR